MDAAKKLVQKTRCPPKIGRPTKYEFFLQKQEKKNATPMTEASGKRQRFSKEESEILKAALAKDP